MPVLLKCGAHVMIEYLALKLVSVCYEYDYRCHMVRIERSIGFATNLLGYNKLRACLCI